MSWKDIIRTDKLNKARIPLEDYRRKANELVDDFAKEVRLPYVLIASRSELLELKSTRYPENLPRYIKHFAELLDVHRDKIPKESQNDLDELIEKLNGLVRELE